MQQAHWSAGPNVGQDTLYSLPQLTSSQAFRYACAGAWGDMSVNKGDVVRIVEAGAADEAETFALLAIAGEKPGFWDCL